MERVVAVLLVLCVATLIVGLIGMIIESCRPSRRRDEPADGARGTPEVGGVPLEVADWACEPDAPDADEPTDSQEWRDAVRRRGGRVSIHPPIRTLPDDPEPGA